MQRASRYFVQYMIKNGTVTVENALTYCKHASNGSMDNLTHLKAAVIDINKEISKHSFRIVIHTCEVTDEVYIIFLNTKNDDIAKMQNTFSALELEYFHAILEEILNNETHRAAFIVVLNLSSTLTSNFSRDSGQKALTKWLKGGYFVRDEENVYLGPRLILEFTSFLKMRQPHSVCNLCSELMFVSKQCGNCDKTFHSYCIGKYLKTTKKCPMCKKAWTEPITVPQINLRSNCEDNDSEDEDE